MIMKEGQDGMTGMSLKTNLTSKILLYQGQTQTCGETTRENIEGHHQEPLPEDDTIQGHHQEVFKGEHQEKEETSQTKYHIPLQARSCLRK
jgi:hypothetical protein